MNRFYQVLCYLAFFYQYSNSVKNNKDQLQLLPFEKPGPLEYFMMMINDNGILELQPSMGLWGYIRQKRFGNVVLDSSDEAIIPSINHNIPEPGPKRPLK
jgi:hypothetical protein